MSIHKPIESPIEQRNTGKGNPNAILIVGRPLNNRQQSLWEQLPVFDSRATVPRKAASMRDLAALTASTGAEYAMFTKGGERLIIRGDEAHVAVTLEMAQAFAAQGYRWTGHTHPGTDDFSLYCSDGDKLILRCFANQDESMIWNSRGHNERFGKD